MKTETAITVLLVVVTLVVLVGAAAYALIATVTGVIENVTGVANNSINAGESAASNAAAIRQAEIAATRDANKRAENTGRLDKILEFGTSLLGGAAAAVGA
jgi:predicted PurR-regulated permease PerM